jgi:hypothetical protein
MLLMQMQQQTQQFSTVMGVGRSRMASPIVGGFAYLSLTMLLPH